MMSRLTAVLSAEHSAYGSRFDELRRIADGCLEASPTTLLSEVDRAIGFLEHDLLPHAAAEDAVLYPAVDQALGAIGASDTMRRDHDEIRSLVRELGRHRDELGSQVLPVARHELQRVLYALHAIVTLHVAKEDELYFPLLERALTDDEATELLRSSRNAAHAAHARADLTTDGLAADGG